MIASAQCTPISNTSTLNQIMPLSVEEKYMSYLERVGPEISEIIRLDRRQKSDGSGGNTERLAETWEEAHTV